MADINFNINVSIHKVPINGDMYAKVIDLENTILKMKDGILSRLDDHTVHYSKDLTEDIFNHIQTLLEDVKNGK